MKAKFEVAEIFTLSTRNTSVVSGRILSGTVERNMYLLSSKNEMFILIASVEAIRSSDANMSTGLLFNDLHEAELDFILQLKPKDILYISNDKP